MTDSDPLRRRILAVSQRRGLSLAETIVALFMLAAGGLTVIGLLLSAFRYQSNSLQASSAAQLSEIVLGRIREYARVPASFQSWIAYDNDSYSDSDFPGFTIAVKSSGLMSTYSPGATLELSRPGGGREMVKSLRVVEIQIGWGTHKHRLVAHLYPPFQPVRVIEPVTVTPSGILPALAKDASLTLEGHLWDSSAREIEGVPFKWSITSVGLGGMGTLDTSLDASEKHVRLFNLFYSGDPVSVPRRWIPGIVTVNCQARYQGVYYSGNSTEVDLAP